MTHHIANNVFLNRWAVFVELNYHGTGASDIARRLKDGPKKDFDCPIVVKEYDMHMRGVDWANNCRNH